jgi:hypothetical protein
MYHNFIKPLLETQKYKLLINEFENMKVLMPDENVYKNNQIIE